MAPGIQWISVWRSSRHFILWVGGGSCGSQSSSLMCWTRESTCILTPLLPQQTKAAVIDTCSVEKWHHIGNATACALIRWLMSDINTVRNAMLCLKDASGADRSTKETASSKHTLHAFLSPTWFLISQPWTEKWLLEDQVRDHSSGSRSPLCTQTPTGHHLARCRRSCQFCTRQPCPTCVFFTPLLRKIAKSWSQALAYKIQLARLWIITKVAVT